MRVLHAAALPYPPSGIVNQMVWEQDAANKLGIPWDVRLFCLNDDQLECDIFVKSINLTPASNRIEHLTNWWRLRVQYHNWLKTQSDQYDLIILRYYVHDPHQYLFTKSMTKTKPILFVHHTFEEAELKTLSKTRSWLESLIARYTLTLPKGLIGVTREIIDYEKRRGYLENVKTFLYPNGIAYEDNDFVLNDRRGELPEFMFVASSFSSWHGLDLLIQQMKQSRLQCKVHLIGKVFEQDLLDIESDNRFVLHGYASHDEIREIAESCWLGFSSFAAYRNDMTELCPLKVREYLKFGLPVYGGHKEVFSDSLKYYRQGELSLESIHKYAYEMRNVSRKQVAEESKKHINKSGLLESLYSLLKIHYS